jgi:hypothetical protein
MPFDYYPPVCFDRDLGSRSHVYGVLSRTWTRSVPQRGSVGSVLAQGN